MPASNAEKVRLMPEVANAAAQLYVNSGPLACCALSDVLLVGFDQAHDFTLAPWLRERIGRTLADDEVIVGSGISAEPGGKIAFYGMLFKVAGKLEPAGVGKLDLTVFIPLSGARKMLAEAALKSPSPPSITPGDISVVLVKFKSGINPDAAALAIESRLPGLRVELASQAITRLRSSMMTPAYAVLAAGAAQWASGIVMLWAVFGFVLQSRRAELSLMRAVGAKLKDIRRMVLLETALLGAIASAAGIAAGGLVLWAMPGMPYPSAPAIFAAAIAAAGICVLTSLSATLYPLHRATAAFSPHSATTAGL